MKCKISVVVPVYNVGKYLAECLESLIGQTLKDIKIICVNDGSTDDSLEILEEYSKKDDRIVIVNRSNGGVSAARNSGLELVNSEYTAFVDSDDYISPDFLEKLYLKAVKTDADIVACSVAYFKDGKLDETNYINKQTLKFEKEIIESIDDKFSFMSSVVVWNKLYKTDLIKRAGLSFVEGCRFEDNYFTFLSSAFANKISFEPSAKYIYRILGNSISSDAHHSPKMFEILKIMDCLGLEIKDKINAGLLSEEYQKVYDAYIIGLFYSWCKKASREYAKEFKSQVISRLENIKTDDNNFIDAKRKCRLSKLINSRKPFWQRLFT